MRNAKLFALKNVKNAKDAKCENAKSPSPGLYRKYQLLRVEPSASEKSSTSEKSTLGMLKVYHILLQFFGIFTQLWYTE